MSLPKIFVALDVPTLGAAINITNLFQPLDQVGVKFGSSLMPYLSAFMRGNDLPPTRLFLDFKLHDIPNTVAAAVETLITGSCHPGPAVLTIHSSGGAKMIEAAANVIAKHNSPTLLTGITVLTSMSEAECKTAYNRTVEEQTIIMLETARTSGCKAIVCAAPDLSHLKPYLGGLKAITPGIRASGASAQDQTRTATPTQAVRNGADALVIGRPITGSVNPVAEAQTTLNEMALAI